MKAAITEAEEQQFFGAPATEQEWKQAQADAAQGYDEDDLMTAAAENAAPIISALKDRRFMDAAHILNRARLTTIDRRAEFALFGRATTQQQGVQA